MDGFTDSSFDREHTRRSWTVKTSHLQRSSSLPYFSFPAKQSPRWTKRIPPASFCPVRVLRFVPPFRYVFSPSLLHRLWPSIHSPIFRVLRVPSSTLHLVRHEVSSPALRLSPVVLLHASQSLRVPSLAIVPSP